MAKDSLTGLHEFGSFLTMCTRHLARNEGKYAIIINDVSNFKFINKFYSHETGDFFITEMAKFFYTEDSDVVCACRIDSEQFCGLVSLGRMSESAFLMHLAIKNAQFEQLMANKYPDIFIHVYTGVYFMTDNKENIRFAFDKAKMAKTRIKGRFDVTYNVYNPEDFEVKENIMEASSLFRRAQEDNRIVAFLQPKVSVSQDQAVGAEVLCRIIEVDGSVIPPGRFIPALEETGVIGTLDRIMIEKAFEIQGKWVSEGKRPIPLSVNVSRQEFIKSDFPDNMISLQEKYKVPAELMEFEILESMFIEKGDMIVRTTNALRSHGFKVSVDDFGSGFSSLNQIANMPADTVKLDNQFARKSLDTTKGCAVVRTLIELLHEIDYHVVFEGIETAEQRDLVSSYGCDVIQGYFYSKPIPVNEFEEKFI